MEARLIIDRPASGAWNMAVDEALLQSVVASGRPCLRFYQWSEATLSLGYFQRYRDRQLHTESLSLPVVRRATGGGAIVHHHELTYSLVLPCSARRPGEATQWYQLLHEVAQQMLHQHGVPAEFWKGATSLGDDQAPFLCFARRATFDLVAGAHKLLGSAQRRARGALLQHGSLLLQPSSYAPQLRGPADFAQASTLCTLSAETLALQWQQRLATRVDWQFAVSQLEPDERQRAATIATSRFADKGWTERRP